MFGMERTHVSMLSDSDFVEAVTTDSWCVRWCLLCVETVGANTSWPVSVNIL